MIAPRTTSCENATYQFALRRGVRISSLSSPAALLVPLEVALETAGPLFLSQMRYPKKQRLVDRVEVQFRSFFSSKLACLGSPKKGCDMSGRTFLAWNHLLTLKASQENNRSLHPALRHTHARSITQLGRGFLQTWHLFVGVMPVWRCLTRK